MRSISKYLGVVLLTLFGFTSSHAGTSASFSVGTDDFYLSVGDYDYLPYSQAYIPGRVNFYEVMSDYGTWVSVSTFGRGWRPYADSSWRPYVNGHWIQTQYGPYWQGYEPWAWVGYHYGNWIYSQRYGWVWIPGYDWHPGRVAWARSNDTIGWSPAPPYGYDYSRGYLSYRGNVNQYSYDDPRFDSFNDEFGGPCYDNRYSNLYCNRGYSNISVNLWVFVDRNRFGYDNYSDYYLGRDYVRNAFDRRLVRIHSRPLRRDMLERVVKQRLREVPVRVRELDTERKRVKLVVPVGQEDRIRRHGNRTVREVIAPAFVQKNKGFKGLRSKNQKVVSTLFRQENRKPKVETLTADQIVRVAKEKRDRQEKGRAEAMKVKNKELVQIEERIRTNERKKKNDEARKISERQKAEDSKKKSKSTTKIIRKYDRTKQVIPAVRTETYSKKDLREVSRKDSNRDKVFVQQPSVKSNRHVDQKKIQSKRFENDKKAESRTVEAFKAFSKSRVSPSNKVGTQDRTREMTSKVDKKEKGSGTVTKKEINRKETLVKSREKKTDSKKDQKKTKRHKTHRP